MKDKVAVINWPEQFPDCPEVSFSLENTGDTLQLNFKVREDRSIARSTFDNDRVWEDSCVEFFIQFEGEQEYYNLEASCNGYILLGYRKDRSSAEHAPQEVMDKIIRKPSLGKGVVFEEQHVEEWTLALEIPVEAFWKSNLKDFSTVKAKGNFYKIADALARPHYVSWAPISTEKPDYHRPEFFQNIL
jgi:hypothetical protein